MSGWTEDWGILETLAVGLTAFLAWVMYLYRQERQQRARAEMRRRVLGAK
jgi:hypothetical protein